jgi:hypothetical protein
MRRHIDFFPRGVFPPAGTATVSSSPAGSPSASNGAGSPAGASMAVRAFLSAWRIVGLAGGFT